MQDLMASRSNRRAMSPHRIGESALSHDREEICSAGNSPTAIMRLWPKDTMGIAVFVGPPWRTRFRGSHFLHFAAIVSTPSHGPPQLTRFATGTVPDNASAKAAPLSTSSRKRDLGISRTYGRFLGIAVRVFCLFSNGCHICCVSLLLETLVFSINLYIHNRVKDVESGAAKADPTKLD